MRAATASPTPWSAPSQSALTVTALLRQEDEEVEREPDRDDDRGRDAGDRERAAGTGADDRVDAFLFGARGRMIAAGMN